MRRALCWLGILLMALSTKVTSFNTGVGVAGTTIDVTLGFQPSAFIVWWNGRTETVDTVGRADSHVGWGFGKNSTNRCCQAWARDDANAAETGGFTARDDSIVFRITTATTADGALDVDATANWPADGIRFIVDTQFGASMRVHIAAIGGTDITNVDLGNVTPSAVVCTNVDITSLSYQPDVVFFIAQHVVTVNTIESTSARIVFGAAISSTKQAVNLLAFDPGSTTGDGGQYVLDGVECSANMNAATMTSVITRIDLIQMLSNGFRVHTLEGGGTPVFWMAIKGGQWDQGSVLTQTDTTTDITGSPAFNGETPKLILFSSGCRVESTQDAATTPTRWSMGAATSATEEAAMAEHGEQGSTNTRVGTAVEHDACYVNLADIAADPDAQTIQGSMHVTATAANSFTCRMTDADPAQSFVWWVAAAPNAAAPSGRIWKLAGEGGGLAGPARGLAA